MSGNSYYDIDCFLAEEERIPCTFQIDALGMGELDPSTREEDISKGDTVDLPLWLTETLAEKGMVKVEFPKQYGERFQEHLLAGPGALKLREYGSWYYEIGTRLSSLAAAGDETKRNTLKTSLLAAFSGERFKKNLDWSLNSQDEDVSIITNELPETELKLFMLGHQAAKEYRVWKERSKHKTFAASTVLKAAATSSSNKKQKVAF
mmetsp:Transcript_17789/g.28031  ORF Transcript_17789/g.28031 Transcript_17789/m.28031 type:complete len:206 (+) Transcript_17789:41-658(+)